MPLRPDLYRRLWQRLGSVIIAHPGEAMSAELVQDDQSGIPRLKVEDRGETYRVCCPFCSDSRHRLWINHRWGLRDPSTQSDNLWLATCFNEDCVRDWERRRVLYNMVYDDTWDFNPSEDVLLEGDLPDPERVKAVAPGLVYPVHTLPENHPAVFYLKARNYNPRILGLYLGVSYCPEAEPRFRPASGRIIIPVYMDKEYVGWQARLVGEPKDKHIPKYYTMPGMKKSQVLYNYDVAKQYPYVVVTEGVTKVWTVGTDAVATLGKKISSWQANLISSTWQNVVIALDGDAEDEAQELYDSLQVKKKAILHLPYDKGPDDFSTPYIRSCLASVAQANGIPMPWQKWEPTSDEGKA